MTRTISRRLRRLETQVGLAMVPPNSHVICFVDVDHRVVSTLDMATGGGRASIRTTGSHSSPIRSDQVHRTAILPGWTLGTS